MRDLSGESTDPRLAALDAELRRGERIIWKRVQTPLTDKSNMAGCGFAVIWTAFSCFWTGMAWYLSRLTGDAADGMAAIFPLFGVPFILIGVMMLARPFMVRKAAKRTIFAVTNERIIKLYKGKGVISQSVPASRIGSLRKVDGKDGIGSLHINLKGEPTADDEPLKGQFIIRDVDNVDDAERCVKELKDAAKRRTAN